MPWDRFLLVGVAFADRLPWLVLLVLVWVSFPWLDRLARRFIQTRLLRLSQRRDLEAVTAGVLRYTRLFIVALLILQIFGLSGVVSTALASVGFVGLVLGLAAQTVASNMVAGIFLLLDNEVNVGDRIEMGTVQGVIQDIRLRSTLITLDDGTLALVPNKKLVDEVVLNRSRVTAPPTPPAPKT